MPRNGSPTGGAPPLEIRRGRRTDFARLAELVAWPAVDASAARSTRLFRRIVNDLAYDFYVAAENGEIAGLVAVSYVRSLRLGGFRATIEDLWVRPEHRRRGIGRRLLEYVVGRAQRRGVKAVEVVTTDAEAPSFLERAGFEPHERCWRLAPPKERRS